MKAYTLNILHVASLAALAMAGVTSSSFAAPTTYANVNFEDKADTTVFSNSTAATIGGRSWNFNIGGNESVSIVSTTNSSGSATKVMALTKSGAAAADTWKPQAYVYLNTSSTQPNLSTLQVDFDFQYQGSVPTASTSSLNVMLKKQNTITATQTSLYSGLSADTWYHYSLTTNGSTYSFVVTKISDGSQAATGTSDILNGVSGTATSATVVFQLGNSSTSAPSVYLDNLVISEASVPEASTACILSAGVALLMSRSIKH